MPLPSRAERQKVREQNLALQREWNQKAWDEHGGFEDHDPAAIAEMYGSAKTDEEPKKRRRGGRRKKATE